VICRGDLFEHEHQVMSRANKQVPKCIFIIVCEHVYRDEATKNLIIVGTFNRIKAKTFPCVHHKMTVLFTLTDRNGQYDMALVVEHAETSKTIAELKGPLTMNDPLAICDFNVVLQGLRFPEDGKYWICLKIDGEIICQRPINVVQTSEG
jgi:hypothetical protein